jgi:proteasome accessory factor B
MTRSGRPTQEKVGKPERLLNLLALFLGSRVPIPFSQIAGRVIGYDDRAEPETLEKRFDRDRADLRDLGVNVEYAQPSAELPAGYFVRKDAIFQRKVTITPEEAVLLSVAGRVGAAATGGGPLFDALRGALRKLAVDVPVLEPSQGSGSVAVLRVDGGNARSRELVAGIAEAIAQARRIRFRYQGMRDERARPRTVSPYGLGLFRGSWYLAGFDHERRGIRVFKAARIQGRIEADPGEPRAEDAVPAGFRMHDHLPKEAHDVGPAAPQAVILRVAGPPDRASFSPGVRPEVLSTDGENSVVAIKVRSPSALVPWVLSSGGEVEVVKPAALRAAVRRAAEALMRAGASGRKGGAR